MITLKAFNASLKSVSGTPAAIQTIAAYAIQQAAIYGNLDPMSKALSAPVFRDQRDNSLNKVGVQLRNYITAHYKSVVIKLDNSVLSIKFKKERDLHLVDVLASRESGERVYQQAPISEGVNLCDFKAFTDYSAPKAPATANPYSISQLNKRIETLAESISERGIHALPSELEQALTAFNALQTTLLAAIGRATSPEVETTALEQVEGVKPSAKSKSAGRKVASK